MMSRSGSNQRHKPRWVRTALKGVAFVILGAVVAALWAGRGRRFDPQPIDGAPFQKRAESITIGNVTVSVVALTPEEAAAAVGFKTAGDDIQPVWIKVSNGDPIRYFIPPITVDGEYYSPMEVAWKGHGWLSRDKNARIDAHLIDLRLPAFVEPGATASGFVFTSLDEGVKYVNLELVGSGEDRLRSFAFLARIPGIKTDYQRVDFEALYKPGEITDLNDDALRAWLEELPCCTKGGDRKTDGDPLNIVMVGTKSMVFSPLARRGWHVTETTTIGSSWDTMVSSVFGTTYRYAPVSPLYLFGRNQDIALQKPRADVNQRNHMRLWLAPVTASGKPVWVGQISRDIGVRLTAKTITTHKVDPQVDETRWYLLQDMFFSQGMKRFGLVKGVGVSTLEAPRTNYTGDPYFTDGLRAVMWMSDTPITYQRVESVRWETPSAR
jgi:hypothetical protein